MVLCFAANKSAPGQSKYVCGWGADAIRGGGLCQKKVEERRLKPKFANPSQSRVEICSLFPPHSKKNIVSPA